MSKTGFFAKFFALPTTGCGAPAGRVPAVLSGVAVAVTFLLATAPAALAASPPTLTTNPAEQVGVTTAKLSGTVNPHGASGVPANTTWRIQYSPIGEANWATANESQITEPASEAANPVTVEAIFGFGGELRPGHEYEFRIVAENGTGNAETPTPLTFEMQPATAPLPSAAPATEVVYTSATLNGTINPEGGNENQIASEVLPIRWQLQYSLAGQGAWNVGGESTIEGAEAIQSSPIAVEAVLPYGALAPNTSYEERLVAYYASPAAPLEASSAPSNPQFTTEAVARPTVANLQVSGVAGHTAHFAADINPNAPEPSATTSVAEKEAFRIHWHFECTPGCPGLSGGELEADNTSQPVAGDATGLTPGIPYEVTLVAENAGGSESAGPDSFETPSVPPAIDSTFATDVVFTEAILHAQVNPGGASTTVHFEYITQQQFEENEAQAKPGFTNPKATPESGSIGSDAEDHEATAALAGLTPDTAYRYRAVATNEAAPSGEAGPPKAFSTFTTAAPSSSCPNEARRTGASASLPDCRAYEMVSPLDKNGGDIFTIGNGSGHRAGINQASIDGNKVTYSSYKSFGDALSDRYVNQYLASRGADGWSTHGISPAHGLSVFGNFPGGVWDTDHQFEAFSPDLSTAWLYDESAKPLTPDAAEGYVNLYRRNNDNDTYQAITTEAPPECQECFNGYRLEVEGSSADGHHAVFNAAAPLTPNAAFNSASQLYDFSAGEIHLVSVLPDGEANPSEAGSFLGSGDHSGNGREYTVSNAVSADGSRIFWSAATGAFRIPGPIYLRENPSEPQSALGGGGECTEPTKACTISVSAGNAQFWTASPDGAVAYFTEGGTLYRFDAESDTATPLSPATGVLGASDDATSVYFTVGGDLYLERGGVQTFIATLSENDVGQGFGIKGYDVSGTNPLEHASRVSADGSSVAFESIAPLTGYDNADAVNGEPDLEVYVYRADTQQLVCVSCRPSGARPNGQPLRRAFDAFNRPVNDNNGGAARRWTAAWLTTYEREMYPARALSANGDRLFFNAFDALLPRDTNGVQDVYEWEAPGAGTCTEAAPSFHQANGGCLSLISSGESPRNSEFVDATPDGHDVFFTTASSLDSRDPGLVDIYDARAEGGFPPASNGPAICEGEACQTPPSPPNDPTPASSAYNGPGNLVEKPVKRKHHKKRKHHTHHKRHTNTNRRAAR